MGTPKISIWEVREDTAALSISAAGAGGRLLGDKLVRQLNVGILLLKGKGIHLPAIQVQAQGCNLHGLGGVNDRGFIDPAKAAPDRRTAAPLHRYSC